MHAWTMDMYVRQAVELRVLLLLLLLLFIYAFLSICRLLVPVFGYLW